MLDLINHPSKLISTTNFPEITVTVLSIRHSWQCYAGRFYCEIWSVGSFAGKSTCLAMVNKCWFRGTYRRRKKIKEAGLAGKQAQTHADTSPRYWKGPQANRERTKVANERGCRWGALCGLKEDGANGLAPRGFTATHPFLHKVVVSNFI